jgi:hypothetical protein
MFILELESTFQQQLWQHLLPAGSTLESAAFLFATHQEVNGKVIFTVQDSFLAQREDFAHQYSDYLELTDETRAAIIKKAHQLGVSIIEAHSHPGPWQAAFSKADLMGLEQLVPHMWWRLKHKPYMALVVAPTGYDALLWWDNPTVPCALEGIDTGGTIIKPTNLTIGGMFHGTQRISI